MTLTFIGAGALVAWIYLAFFRSGYWRAGPRLSADGDLASWPAVAAIIPARNEAETIRDVLRAHLGCDYPGPLTIVVADDASHDGTGAAARAMASEATGQGRQLVVVETANLPAGWTGKLWAMRTALARAGAIAPDATYALFCDADILLAPSTLRRLVAKAETERLALASLMATLDARGLWGGLLIPAFIYFFQKLYPFARANDPNDPAAAAAGGCMLACVADLTAAGGLERIRGALIDDCALAALLKDSRADAKIWIGLAGEDARSLRDNRSIGSVWNMVARTAYAQLRHSPPAFAGTVIGMTAIYIAPPALTLTIAAHGNWTAALLGVAAWALMAATYVPMLRFYGQPARAAGLLPVAAAFYTAMTVHSAVRHWRGRGGRWKGRSYSGARGP